jgi:uncharacterized damage-inducible protein DinB
MKTHFVMMANYNEWANARLFRAAGTLKEALYRKDVGAYFRSLHGTLNHLLVADRIWMRRLTGTGEHPEKLNAILFEDLPSLHVARVAEDNRIIAFVQSLDEPAFEEMLDYRTLNGTPQRQRRREIGVGGATEQKPGLRMAGAPSLMAVTVHRLPFARFWSSWSVERCRLS